MAKLNFHNHSRDSAGYTYVYPVVSRRAGGVSVGINLNPNNACNWACIYCQVPGLVRGNAPVIDLLSLERELREFLGLIVHGNWLESNVPQDSRVLQDIAFSGNGEPTSAEEFPAAVTLAANLLQEFGLQHVRLRLITNGSLVGRPAVQQALRLMAKANGEVWFKLDRASSAGMAKVNQVNDHAQSVIKRLVASTEICSTWIQTCWFALDGAAPEVTERDAYLEVVREMRGKVAGVHLYGLARQPMQPGSERLSSLTEAEMEAFADEIRRLGVTVTVNQ